MFLINNIYKTINFLLHNIIGYGMVLLFFTIGNYLLKIYMTKNLEYVKTIDDIPIYKDKLSKQISENSYTKCPCYCKGDFLFYQSYFIVIDEKFFEDYPTQQYFILAHEISHIKRHHLSFLLFGLLIINFISDNFLRNNIKNNFLFNTIVILFILSFMGITMYLREMDADIAGSYDLLDSELENGIKFFNADREDNFISWLLDPHPSDKKRIEYLTYCLRNRKKSVFYYLFSYYIDTSGHDFIINIRKPNYQTISV
jgi:hypothetical protein